MSLMFFIRQVRAAGGQCWVDVGFWGGVIPGNAGNLQEMVRAGVPGSALLTPRVSSKQTKNIFGSNRKEPKLNLFRLCSGLFHETKK
jgi:hypothetical protein